MYIPYLVYSLFVLHSTLDGQPKGCLHLLVVVKNVAMITGVQTLI